MPTQYPRQRPILINMHLLGEKKSLEDLVNDGEQVRARVKAPKAFRTKGGLAERKRQTGRDYYARTQKKQRKQADVDAATT